jgi:hypothetical protein
MRGTNKAKEMKRRASQRRATHKARRAALMLRAETRMAVVEAGKGKTKVGSKGPAKLTAEASRPKNQAVTVLGFSFTPRPHGMSLIAFAKKLELPRMRLLRLIGTKPSNKVHHDDCTQINYIQTASNRSRREHWPC